MRNASHVRMIRLLVFGVLVLAGTSWAQQRSPIADQIAKTYGLDSFGQIEAIRYTFNLDLGKIKLSRTWVWEPKADQISYDGKVADGRMKYRVMIDAAQINNGPLAVKLSNTSDPAKISGTVSVKGACAWLPVMWSVIVPEMLL